MRFLAVLLCFAASIAGAATLTVDDDGPADYTTIQAAVDVSQTGDTVLIKAGIYQESVVIDGKSNLTVRGVHRDSVTVLRTAGTNVRIVEVKNSNGVTLSDITTESPPGESSVGIAVSWSQSVAVTDCAMLNTSTCVGYTNAVDITFADNQFIIDGLLEWPQYLQGWKSTDIKFGRNKSVVLSAPLSASGGSAFYFETIETEVETYRVWGNRLAGSYQNAIKIVLSTETGLQLNFPNNVLGSAQTRHDLGLEGWARYQCSGETRVLVDPVRSSLSEFEGQDMPPAGTFSYNVFPESQNLPISIRSPGLPLCGLQEVIYTAIRRTTWGEVKARFR